MRFDRIRLENFKCYGDADLSLDRGVTVIHGLNGSGKSSLLEAAFFALYGSKALDRTLDEVVTIGEEETSVELWFTHAGESYHIFRRLKVRDDRAETVEAVLDGPDGTHEGAQDVRHRVANLLRMDNQAFVNCAYVRQGEVNKLINASPGERQDMLDDLLQLGKLEDYRERASQARVGVGRVRDDKQGALSEVTEQIGAKEEKNLHEQLNALEEEIAEVEAQIDRFETNQDEAKEKLDQANAVLEAYEEKQRKLSSLAEDIETLTAKINETEREREELSEQITQTKETLSTAESRRDDLLADTPLESPERDTIEERIESIEAETDELTERVRELSVEKRDAEKEAEQRAQQADELEAKAEEKYEKARRLEQEVEEGRELVAEKRDQLDEMSTEIARHRAAFDDAPIDVGEASAHRETVSEEYAEVSEERAETRASLENARERLEEAQQLKAEGKCPECGQPVEDSPHVEAIEERREEVERLESRLAALTERERELEARRDRAKEFEEHESELERLRNDRANARQLVNEREQTLEEKAATAATTREEASDLETDASETREAAAEARDQVSEYQEVIAERNQEKATLDEDKERLEALLATVDRIADLRETIEDLRADRATKADLNDERREHLADKRSQRDDLTAEFDEQRVEAARERKENAKEYLEDVAEKLDELTEKHESLQNDIGRVSGELDELDDLRERRDDLEATVERLSSLYDEATQLEEMYGTLRAELRQRNVETLERMLNETFDLVYGNDSYSRLELDGEYRLTVYQKDGETLEPDQLSGGERALFNLSLRCAIYRLLSEGIEGTAPMPPLILDEPTVFLDSGHVSRLVELIDAMREMGVEQILVVSHDEELVGAADDLVTVRKDATTNRSTVERVDSVDDRLLAEATD